MTKICAFCLSNDRNLSLIDEAYWNVVNSWFSSKHETSEYPKCLHSEHVLQICWECSAKLRKWQHFISTSQQCVRVLNSYVGAPTQTLPATKSKLYTTNIESIDIGPKYEEKEKADVTKTVFVKSEIGYCNVTKESKTKKKKENKTIKSESSSSLDDDDTNKYLEPTGDNDDDDVLCNNDDGYDVIKECLIEESPEQLPPETDIMKNTKPKCTVLWATNEQAQTWYTSELEQERATPLIHTHLCDKCRRSFAGEQELQAHVEMHHSEAAGKYTCNMCQYRFANQALLKHHIESHYLFYKCKKCSYETRTLSQMQGHNNTEHAVKRRCKRCKTYFPTISELRAHKTECNTYKCSECDMIYKSRSGYHYHVASHKPETKNKVTEGAVYCEMCDIRFKKPLFYMKHLQSSLRHVSRDVYKHQCQHCGMKFPTGRRLRDHVASIHLKKGRYQCEVCPKSYMSRPMYQRHLAKQHSVGADLQRDKTCDKCGKTFTSHHLLQNHIRTHTGEKPCKCQFCPAAFAQTGSLYRHCKLQHKKKISTSKVNISKGETFEDVELQKHICEECGKDFMFTYQLRDHINYVHKGRTDYVCKYCNKMYSSAAGLTRHNKLSHDAGAAAHRNSARTAAVKNASQRKPQSTDRILKCRACDASFRHNGALYTHYKLKHLKLKRSDRVRIRNLCKSNKEIVVDRDP